MWDDEQKEKFAYLSGYGFQTFELDRVGCAFKQYCKQLCECSPNAPRNGGSPALDHRAAHYKLLNAQARPGSFRKGQKLYYSVEQEGFTICP